MQCAVVASAPKQSQVQITKISETIENFRKEVCGKVKDTDVKIWLKYDATANVFGIIGAGFENGIEVTLHCK